MKLSQKTTNKWFMLAIVLTAPLLYVVDIFIINIAIPTIKSNLNATDGEVQLVIAGYLLGSASFLIIGARAGDYLGKKQVFFWGMFWFTISSCLCGLCQTALQLDIARFFQGVSSAFMVTQSISLIQILFTDPKGRAIAIGCYGITLSIAAIIGQILGGYLAETNYFIEGWRMIFFINLPIGIIALIAIRKYLSETTKIKNVSFDYFGATLLTLSLSCLIYGVTQGRENKWPIWSFVLIFLFLVFILLFICFQRKLTIQHSVPLLNMHLFSQTEFNIGLLAVLFHFMLHTAYLLMIAVFLQNGLGISALACGMYFIPHALLFMISSIIASKVLVRYGKKILQIGIFIILISFLLQIFFFKNYNSSFYAMFFIGIYGLGNGLVLPFLLNIVLNSISTENAGNASGIFSTFQQVASALGIAIIGGIFFNSLEKNNAVEQYLSSLQHGLIACIICLTVVALMLLFLPNNFKQNAPEIEKYDC